LKGEQSDPNMLNNGLQIPVVFFLFRSGFPKGVGNLVEVFRKVEKERPNLSSLNDWVKSPYLMDSKNRFRSRLVISTYLIKEIV